MEFLTYRATPGLDRYPEGEQFKVWQEAHQHLMRADYSYARQHQAYVATMTKVATGLSLAGVPLALGVVAALLGQFVFHWPASYGVAAVLAGVLILLLAILRVWRMANGQQRFMNNQVAAVLRQRAATP